MTATTSMQQGKAFAVGLVASTAVAALLLYVLHSPSWAVVADVALVQVVARLLATPNSAWTQFFLGIAVTRAMAAGQIVMHYQPKVDLETGELVGMEALARWDHPRRGLVGPDEWLAGTEVGWVEWRFVRCTLVATLRQAREWGAGGEIDAPVSINVTPRCFADRRFPGLLRDVAQDVGGDLLGLQIELTEAALDLSPVAVEVAHELNRMGVGLALDDFGIGGSSMERLVQLPINELKIDRRFVMRQLSSPRDAAVVRGAIDLGHALGLSVTAEGVEHARDAESLRRLGCDIAQGYLFAPALPARELVTWHAQQWRTRVISEPANRSQPALGEPV